MLVFNEKLLRFYAFHLSWSNNKQLAILSSTLRVLDYFAFYVCELKVVYGSCRGLSNPHKLLLVVNQKFWMSSGFQTMSVHSCGHNTAVICVFYHSVCPVDWTFVNQTMLKHCFSLNMHYALSVSNKIPFFCSMLFGKGSMFIQNI